MKKVHLHIGTHKTGSTAVQIFATQHSTSLARRGVLYPETGRPVLENINVGHHLLPWTRLILVEWDEPWGKYVDDKDRIWDDLILEISNSPCDHILISSEEFDVLNDDGVRYVAERLEGFDVQVLCYLRRLDEFVQAYYTTDVLYHSEKRCIDAYISEMRTTTDYHELVSRWRRHFGESNVDVHFYSRDYLKDKDIVVDVFESISCDVTDLRAATDSKFINSGGFPWQVIETIRVLNNLDTPRDVVRVFVNIAEEVYREHGSQKYSLLTAAKAGELVESGLSCIDQIRVETFGGSLRESFAGMLDADYVPAGPSAEDSNEAMRKCFEDILACLKSKTT